MAEYHTVTMYVKHEARYIKFSAKVGFTALPQGCAGLLGQIGFFDHFKVILDQPGRLVTLEYK